MSSQCTVEDFATYSVGAFELPLVGIITVSITTVLLADMARECQAGHMSQALTLFQTGALRSAAILLPAMVFFGIVAQQLIEVLYSPKYRDSVMIFRLYLLVLPIRIVTFGAALMALGKTTKLLLRSVIDLVLTASLSAVLVMKMGYSGAICGLLLTLYAWTTPWNLSAIAKGFNVRIIEVLPFATLARMLLIAVVAGVPVLAVCHYASLSHIYMLIVCALMYWPTVVLWLLHQKLIPSFRVSCFKNLLMR